MTRVKQKLASLTAWIARLFRRRRITRYMVIIQSDAKRLDRLVTESIQNGWQPFGSLNVYYADNGFMKAQPMVKYD